MGHTGAAHSLHQGLLYDTVLHIQAQLAGALLGCAPADTVRETGDVADLVALDPLAFFRNGSRTVMRTLFNGTHLLNFI